MKRMNHSYPNEGQLLAQAKAEPPNPSVAERSPQPASVITAQVLTLPQRRSNLAS